MSLTNQEILEAQRRHQRLSERSKTIIRDLSIAWESGSLSCDDLKLMLDAREVIEWLQEQIAGYRKDLMEEAKETSRAARESYAEGRADAERESGEW